MDGQTNRLTAAENNISEYWFSDDIRSSVAGDCNENGRSSCEI